MKRLLISIFILSAVMTSYSQSESTNQFDLSGYIFTNNVFRFSEIEGAGYVDNGEGIRFGLQYSKLIKSKLWINTGFGYLRTSNVYHGAFIGPMEPLISQSQESNIIQIPVRIRYDLLNWLYFKSGLTFDFQTNNKEGIHVDNQSGIGFSLVGGVDLKMSESLQLNIEPELGFTSLIPFIRDDYQQHFLLTGVNFNLGYRF